MTRIFAIITVGFLLAAAPEASRAQSPEAIAHGAQVWAQNCTRCHNGRSPLERDDRDWATVVLHMRARANLTRSEADAVAVFLQATNAPEPGAAPPSPPAGPTRAGETETKPTTGESTLGDGTGAGAPDSLSEEDVRAITGFLEALR